jgi:hypothetical protein
MARSRAEDGQASIELVALLPLLGVVAMVAWQGVVAGQAWWMASAAAREAARAEAVGGDPVAAARGVLPGALRGGVSVVRDGAGEGDGVRVRLVVPVVLGHASLGTITARARMEPQA